MGKNAKLKEKQKWLREKPQLENARKLQGIYFIDPALLEEKPPDGYMWSGWRLTRKQLTSRPDHLWPELWKSMGKNAKLKEKQKWSEEKAPSGERTDSS